MANVKLSQLIKIISRENAERVNSSRRVYDPTYKGGDRKQEKRRTQQEANRNRDYMRTNQKKYI